MVHLRILGTVQLHAPDGGEVRAVLAQPRRFALLVWLALHGTVQRDTLLGVFSPESDTRRARSALRNALHFLRHHLGAETIESIGDGGLRVSSERLECDVRAFEDWLDRGRLAEAIELYRGDLLAGFHIDGAPEFERWVEEERSRLHGRTIDALAELIEQAEEAGRRELAAHYARRALSLEPLDESIVRRLVTLQWREGDRPGAIRTYEEFVDLLETEYDLEPTPETTALVESLRRETREAAAPAPEAEGPESLD
ncbi:MAG: BTAD domain-containing putative transcriptional regulator, partial [Gemmatimonadota bacterium]|nr:BTAD domain-containing putative transcriptional regulator [Gemmatimonadota bacterium]